ncbi:MAG: LamG-like jellyroll fold domain-containing protein [Planctomycetota bacterium]
MARQLGMFWDRRARLSTRRRRCHHQGLSNRRPLSIEACEPRLLLSVSGAEASLQKPTVVDDVLWGTLRDDDSVQSLDAGRFGVNAVFGSYGNDRLIANNRVVSDRPGLPSPSAEIDIRDYANVLNGGHGKDQLIGSDLPDLLISRSDGREPVIAQNYNSADDPLDEIDPQTNTHYPAQPLDGDDVLVGGGGADLFYFQTLINAKERIILEHVRDDGTINWHGVAHENDRVHDHWVDGLGDELIADFDRMEGDHILIGGHTTEVYKREYIDTNQDNVVDSTVLHIWSNQGNGGGAHNKDLLGTITVAHALLNANDYSTYDGHYGIVESVSALDEAVQPYSGVPDDGVRPEVRRSVEQRLPEHAVLYIPERVTFTGGKEDYGLVEHGSPLELSAGTVALNFTADDISGQNALFSKDARQQLVGGHLTAFVWDGRLQVRLQSTEESIWLKSPVDSIEVGQPYHMAVSFGPEGFHLFLDGQLVNSRANFQQGLDTNLESLALGANIWGRSADDPQYARHEFTGTISNFTVYARQWTPRQLTLAPTAPLDSRFWEAAPCQADRVACVEAVFRQAHEAWPGEDHRWRPTTKTSVNAAAPVDYAAGEPQRSRLPTPELNDKDGEGIPSLR